MSTLEVAMRNSRSIEPYMSTDAMLRLQIITVLDLGTMTKAF